MSTVVALSAQSTANGQWQESVRAQAGYDTGTAMIFQNLYTTDAPQALRVHAARIRARALEDAAAQPGASPVLRALGAAESTTAQRYLDAYLQASNANDLLSSDPRYAVDADGAPRVTRLLVDRLAAHWREAADPARFRTAGDRAARRVDRATGLLYGSAGVAPLGLLLWLWARCARHAKPRPPVVVRPRCADAVRGPLVGIGVVLALTLTGRARSRRPRLLTAIVAAVTLVAVGAAAGRGARRHRAEGTPPSNAAGPAAAEPPELMLGPPELPATPIETGAGAPWLLRPRSWPWIPAVLVVLAVSTTAVTAWQIRVSTAESRMLADAARLSIDLTSAAIIGSTQQAFGVDSQQAGFLAGQGVDDLARTVAQADGGDAALVHALLTADATAARRIEDLSRAMARRPTVADGLDPHTVDVLNGAEVALEALLEDQQSAARAADATGERADRLVDVVFALSLLNICVQFATWRRNHGRRRPEGEI
jgi:hypothetical protein